MRRRTLPVLTAAAAAVFPAMAGGHYSQRVWVDVDNNGHLRSMVGPPGNAPFTYTSSMFFNSRVFARDLGGQDDVNYTTLLGGPLSSDLDADDDGVNYESNFPGYEQVPFPTTAFTGTYGVAIVGHPLYYQPAAGTKAAAFVPVAAAFAGQTLPSFSLSNVVAEPDGTNEIVSMDSNGNGAASVPAFTVGSHGHPDVVLHPNPEDDDYAGPGDDVTDADQYDGIYALPLQLVGPSGSPAATNSDVFYEVMGKNAPLAEVAQAGVVAENTLVAPIAGQWKPAAGGSWATAANWTGGTPTYTGDTATFATVAGAGSATTVTLDGNWSVGHLVFDSSSTSYTLAAGTGGTLTLGADVGAGITVLAGTHVVSAPVAFAVALTVNTSADTGLTFAGPFSFPPAAAYPYPSMLTKSGGGTLTFSAPITAGYASTLLATGGTTVFAADPTAGLSLTATGTGTRVTFTAAAAGTGIHVRNAATLTVAGGAAVQLAAAVDPADRTVLDVGGLSIDATSTLDVGTNDLVIRSPDAATAAATLSAVTALVRNGYASGTWTGTGGVTSRAAAADATRLTAVGVIPNQAADGSALYPTFDGLSDANPGTDVLVRYTYYGDANLDGIIDGRDYALIDIGFLQHLTGWQNGDFNYDGKVDASDYTLIDNAFNRQAASSGTVADVALVAVPTATVAAVPEPAFLGVASLVAGCLARKPRRGR